MDVSFDVTNVLLKTPRLVLRPLEHSDLADVFAYASVEGVGEAAGWPHHKSVEESERILRVLISGKDIFALFHKADRRVIGTIGVHTSWANDDPAFSYLKLKEIGYVLSKDYWGLGLMPEAAGAVIAHCFDNCGIEALTCGHFTTNIRSERVIKKCGFTFLKDDIYYSKQLEKKYADKKYILLKADYLQGKKL